ncbi:hypothetical protein [Streptomyces fragilis]|uniref:Terminase small subunit n=1 Tax=Streptomyces fragilis TaxID=67301 RepID=A0ABV2YAH4_9ACTN|nr:hypothetical protein [Streptomyces fragilis]
MNQRKYTEEEKLAYLEKASLIGHSRARRELGYPNSWSTANSWSKEFGVEIALSELKQKSSAFNQWYREEELLIAMQDIIDRGMEIVNERPDITGDELKKTAEAVNKAVQTMNLIQGKATSRNGTEQPSETDKAIENLSKAFQAAEQKVTGLGAPEGI